MSQEEEEYLFVNWIICKSN